MDFNRLIDLIENGSVANYGGSFTYEEPYSIESLLPSNLDTYYRYQ